VDNIFNKQDYIELLRVELTTLGVNDIDDIIADYRMYFEEAENDGVSANEFANKLGSPKQVAKQYIKINQNDFEQEKVIDTSVVDEPKSTDKKHTPDQTSSKAEGPKNTTQQDTKNRRTPLASFIVFCGLAFLNLTFVLGPFIAIWATWFAFFVAGIALVAESIRLIVVTSMADYVAIGISGMTQFAQIGFYLTFGMFLVLIMLKAGKGLGYLTKKYVNWNVDLVKGV